MNYFRKSDKFKYYKTSLGIGLMEVLVVTVVVAIIGLTLGAVYIYYVDVWKKAQASIELYESASYLYRVLYDGVPEMGFGSVKHASMVDEPERYKACPCTGSDKGNQITIKGISSERRESYDGFFDDDVTYYHDPTDSTFWGEYDNDHILLIPRTEAFGGVVEDDDLERIVYVENVCFWKDKDREDLLWIDFTLSNIYGEKVRINSAILVRNMGTNFEDEDD